VVCLPLAVLAQPQLLHSFIETSKASSALTYYRTGSSRGRGNRAAAWFADHIKEQSDENMQSLALEGGIKGWVAEKGQFLQYMQEYDETCW
jgi:arsenical-resistance protein 2